MKLKKSIEKAKQQREEVVQKITEEATSPEKKESLPMTVENPSTLSNVLRPFERPKFTVMSFAILRSAGTPGYS